MRLRTPSEIAFRVRQEARNAALFARPAQLPTGAKPRAPFPDPDAAVKALRSTPTAAALEAWAEQIVLHRFPLLGLEIETGKEIRWRRDYVNDKETPAVYFRRLSHLNAAVSGDHKFIWELNRHQHLVLLAQVHRLTGQRKYLDEIANQLDSWFQANPVQCGINWASALEVAFRSLSWMWVDRLVGDALTDALRARLWEGLYQHALHLETNLSVYYSPNTHLLGEAVALHALGVMFRGSRASQRWEQTGARIVREEMHRQVRADGSYFEQSSYYHVYALDMFLFHATLTEPSEEYRLGLQRMAIYLEALMGPCQRLPFLGDDDGGRFFHPYGPRERFGAATLAACGCYLNRPEWIGRGEEFHELALWWLGSPKCSAAIGPTINASVRFPDAGIISMNSSGIHCIVDAGPFGPFRGGHSHADTLSIVARANGKDVLIDPGTFTYSVDPWRDRFRGTAAHNTVRIGKLDQAEPSGSFGWRTPPQAEISEWRSEDSADYLDAVCRYRGFTHRRRVYFLKPEFLFILDDLQGDEIDAEQFWHPGGPVEHVAPGCFRIASTATLLLDGNDAELSQGGEFGWRSFAYGVKEPAPVVVSRRTGKGAVQFGAVVVFSVPASESTLTVTNSGQGVEMITRGAGNPAVVFPSSGLPRCSRWV